MIMSEQEWLEKMKEPSNCCECKSFDESEFECYVGRIQSENKFCEKFINLSRLKLIREK